VAEKVKIPLLRRPCDHVTWP